MLVALCRPATSSELFVEPSSVREIAALLEVSEGAVKQHLLNLYEKFDIATAMSAGVLPLRGRLCGPAWWASEISVG